MGDATEIAGLSMVEVGGLDLRNGSISSPRGTLRDCLNFIFDQEGGAVRDKGWCKYDGTVVGPDLQQFVIIPYLPGAIVGTFQYGELITIQQSGFPQQVMICLGTANVGFGNFLAAAYPYTDYTNWVDPTSFTTSATVQGLTSLAQLLSIVGVQVMTDPSISVTQYNAIQKAIQAKHSATVQPVPGDPLRPVDCEFGFNNNVYAIHDCVMWHFNVGAAGVGGVPLEGHYLRGSTGVLAGVTVGRLLQIDVTGTGSFDSSNASGKLILYDCPIGMATPTNGDRFDLYDANNVALVTANVLRYSTAAVEPARGTRALLYQTTDQVAAVKTLAGLPPPAQYMDRISTQTPNPRTWTRPRLTREISYTQKFQSRTTGSGFGPVGANDFSIYEYTRQGLTRQLQAATPITAAEKFPTVATQPGVAWLNPNNIFADDGVFTTNNTNLNYIRGSGFDFSFIPPGSRILGVSVRVKGLTSAVAPRNPYIGKVYLTIPDPQSQPAFGTGWRQGVLNKGGTDYRLTAANASYTFGGNTDLWGEQITVQMLQDPDFGVMVGMDVSVGGALPTFSLDCLTVTVTYVPPTRQVYIRNSGGVGTPPADIPVYILHYSIDNGSFTDAGNPAQGVLTFWVQTTAAGATATEGDATNAGMSRVIGAGEEIWTGPGGTGTLLGYTNSGHAPISFPAGAMLDQFQSMYETIDANFYDDVNARAGFICNGVEFAVMFDGQYTARVRTGRPTDQDNPRFLAAHLNYLHLGFASGAVVNCGTNRPLSVIQAPGSNTYNFGEPITGLLTLNGQTLGVWTSNKTRGLQGSSPAPDLGGYSPIIISPAVGAIEHSVRSVLGEATWMSFRGVETVRTVQAYGDFETLPMTWKVTPWLRSRVQGDSNIATAPGRFITAVGVRNDRQYRAFFGDGYILTVTVYDGDKEPECSIQCLGRPIAAATFPDYGVQTYLRGVVRHVSQAVRTDGKEQIFASFENLSPIIIGPPNYNFPYVVQLAAGAAWDIGLDMPCWIDFNGLYFGNPEQQQKNQEMTIFVNALAGTQLRVYTLVNFDGPMDPAPLVTSDPNVNTRQLVIPQYPAADARLRLPVPQVAVNVDIPSTGRMLRLRIDANQDVDSNVTIQSVRITHLGFQIEPERLDKS